MKDDALLRLEDVSVHYDGVVALNNVSLYVAPREIVVMMGPNGAGKTTVLRAILGLAPMTSGTIYWESTPLRVATHQLVQIGIAFVPQGRRVFNHLTVEENLEMGALLISSAMEKQRRLAGVMNLFPALSKKRREMAGLLSGGQQQMVAFARALMAAPRLLVLDEPTVGLAPKVVNNVFSTIADVNRQTGTGVLLVEHNIKTALDIAHRAYILDKGEVVYGGTSENVRQSKVLNEVFLGHAHDA